MDSVASVFLYAPGGKGRRLAEALDASRLKTFDGLDFWDKGQRLTLPPDAVIVNWARVQLDLEGVRLLNGGSYHTEDTKHILRALYSSGFKLLPTSFSRGPQPSGGANVLHRWLSRRWDDSFHPLHQPAIGHTWTRLVDLKREFRLHMFNGRCIKSGEKVVQTGLTIAPTERAWVESQSAHPWWRSSQAGWTVDYDMFRSTDDMRKLAKRAVAALGLHFAAVDLGQDADGTLWLLNVNPTPVLTPSLAVLYARVIHKWIDNPKAEGEEDIPALPPREAPYYIPPPVPVAPNAGEWNGRISTTGRGGPDIRHHLAQQAVAPRAERALRHFIYEHTPDQAAAVVDPAGEIGLDDDDEDVIDPPPTRPVDGPLAPNAPNRLRWTPDVLRHAVEEDLLEIQRRIRGELGHEPR